MSKIAVIYWSGTGNTEAMAEAIAEGIKSKGLEANLYSVSDINAADAAKYDAIAFGCPSMGAEVLEESEFEPFFEAIEGDLAGKKVALFGSYDWGDGEWMREWQTRVEDKGANLFEEGLIINLTPDTEGTGLAKAFGERFASF